MSSGSRKWTAYWGAGIDNLVSVSVGNDEYLAVHDGRGSVAALHSAVSNRVVAALDYSPEDRTGWRTFDGSGTETSNCEERDSDATCGGALGVPFGFHTALKSEGTGLLYFRNRWYSTTAGQWLSRDALGPVDSHNLYAFNGFDSVNFVDPWGLSSEGLAKHPGTTVHCMEGNITCAEAKNRAALAEAKEHSLFENRSLGGVDVKNSGSGGDVSSTLKLGGLGSTPTPQPVGAGAVVVTPLIPELPSLLPPLGELLGGLLAGVELPLVVTGGAVAWCLGTQCFGAGGVAAMDPNDKHAEERGSAAKKFLDDLVEKKNAVEMSGAKGDDKATPKPAAADKPANTASPNPDPKEPKDADGKPKEVFNGVKNAPGYPQNFTTSQGGQTATTTRNPVTQRGLLENLRRVEPGNWQKVYKDGWVGSDKVSLHYFQSESGKVFDFAVKPGWSN